MNGHFSNGIVVCDQKSLKSPFVTKHVCQQPFICRSRYAVYYIKRTHHTTDISLNRRPIRSKIFVIHTQMAHVDCIIILTGF